MNGFDIGQKQPICKKIDEIKRPGTRIVFILEKMQRACQAGKHVYVEKPLSHYIWEGRQMANAARKYRRIVQCGMQHRSEASIIQLTCEKRVCSGWLGLSESSTA
jgi:ABC-type sugar transport system ATPase subunit